MKTNYKIKVVRNTLAVLAIALGSAFATAQVATDYSANIRSDAAITAYPDGPANMISEELTHEGVTFKIQMTVTPAGTGTYVGTTGANRRWGIGDSADAGNTETLFEGDEDESATISNISIVDFNDNETGYTQGAISNLHFDALTIRGAQGSADNPSITVDGTNPGTSELGQLSATTTTFEFGVEFSNLAGTTFTVGDPDNVSSITLTAPANFQNTWQIIGTNISYTFTTDPNLSVKDNELDNSFSIYPTVVENTFSVNKEFKTLQLFDITGKIVKTFRASDALNVSGINSGLYIVKMQSETGGTATSKLLIK
ncbi:T9SS type A sorting domain-containing protein [Lacinutrix sp. C3R15]|uniref:T9SS type A sorting domain-containing protein n=1 Tax=Flavobacteriaceae TaxID=49546 RepID=UPI001C0A32F3|nr:MULTISPECIES: T9SS type A sorting domain-containing protein [Flavobacteriaceae]MBU2939196.1 T9SS type A sorting domain-containing protein [Lacinutrix sp. C3R15]MDO6622512.1 T9SS type A sorting domain-containing protein [Oceanihabitans sp. 1_MG-2023]